MKGVAIGAGYFSHFHFDAWQRIDGVELTAICDQDADRAEQVATQYGIARWYADVDEMLDAERPDFADVITRPETHLPLCRAVAERGIDIICQKPLAPTFAEAEAIAALPEQHGVRLMVHENFRFQPWYREIKQLLNGHAVGDQLHSLNFRLRTGDGFGPDAYLARQPYFRTMPRLLIYETGIHFIDTFRYLAGEVARVFCHLRQLNPVIVGEDCGLVVMDFADGASGLWDANRFNESPYEDARYTFGEMLVEANGGSIRLAVDGRLTVQRLGEAIQVHDYGPSRHGFAGDCVWATQRHFVDQRRSGEPFETDIGDYLQNLRVQEACYRSNEEGRPIDMNGG